MSRFKNAKELAQDLVDLLGNYKESEALYDICVECHKISMKLLVELETYEEQENL